MNARTFGEEVDDQRRHELAAEGLRRGDPQIKRPPRGEHVHAVGYYCAICSNQISFAPFIGAFESIKIAIVAPAATSETAPQAIKKGNPSWQAFKSSIRRAPPAKPANCSTPPSRTSPGSLGGGPARALFISHRR
ncbi:hypothetical protein [Accumulibacter sp.]|uniref:hypothetical protein n=1 Tax=Accumulibacter sp. TaxID=2053492 RepID=UPI002C0F089F|nr:hypothetical protein [Accumulibacter sp.]HRF04142.1 hypothetical protein [Accumulibacter sp.]